MAHPILLAVLVGGGLGQWVDLAPMNVPRQETAAARIGDTVYVAGGLLGPGVADTVEAYDIGANSWSVLPPMPAERHHAMAAAHGTKFYVIGGYALGNAVQQTVFVYDTAVGGSWTTAAPIPLPRAAAWAVELGGKFYVVGGVSSAGQVQATTFIYDPVGNSWTQGASMGQVREHLTATALGSFVYAIGGRAAGSSFSSVERYDPAADAWEFVAPMPTARAAPATAAFGGRIYVIGGESPMLFSVNEAYDPGTDTWTTLAPMAVPRHGIAAVALDDSVLVPAGGLVQGLQPTAHVDAFVPPALPPPVVYCTSKVNSQGCAPVVSFSGQPSATSPNPFDVTAEAVLNNKSGLFFYGLAGPKASPFQGGTMCVAPPRRRTPLQSSGGNPPPDDCSGVWTIDFNARIQSGVDPSLVAGVTVNGQFWGRDPQSGSTTSLTNAVQFAICP